MQRPASAASAAAAAAFLLALAMPGTALADDDCATCAKEVITTAELAQCFLDQYDALAGDQSNTVMVDLSNCPSSRGVIEPLALPAVPGGAEEPVEPTTRFMLSRTQLACFKRKLEDPAVVLDPAARIELDGC